MKFIFNLIYDLLSNLLISVPGGSLSQDGEKPYTTACIFAAPDTMESMREQEQVRNFRFIIYCLEFDI